MFGNPQNEGKGKGKNEGKGKNNFYWENSWEFPQKGKGKGKFIDNSWGLYGKGFSQWENPWESSKGKGINYFYNEKGNNNFKGGSAKNRSSSSGIIGPTKYCSYGSDCFHYQQGPDVCRFKHDPNDAKKELVNSKTIYKNWSEESREKYDKYISDELNNLKSLKNFNKSSASDTPNLRSSNNKKSSASDSQISSSPDTKNLNSGKKTFSALFKKENSDEEKEDLEINSDEEKKDNDTKK